MPKIGDTAPSFVAESTLGTIRFPEDYNGKWVILFSHPADFTAVCTSELMLFGAMQEEFEQLDCRLVGLSVGTLSSHIAWMHSMEQNIEFKGHSRLKMRFPLIADMSMEVARKYGMIAPRVNNTMAVRSVFVIDPDAKVRAVVSYPMQVGRNFNELKRLVVALQTSDKHHVALPADWMPGDDVIVPAPTTYNAGDRSLEGMTCYDWYFCMKPLPLKKHDVEKMGITHL